MFGITRTVHGVCFEVAAGIHSILCRTRVIGRIPEEQASPYEISLNRTLAHEGERGRRIVCRSLSPPAPFWSRASPPWRPDRRCGETRPWACGHGRGFHDPGRLAGNLIVTAGIGIHARRRAGAGRHAALPDPDRDFRKAHLSMRT